MADLMKEKAYKILMVKYRSMNTLMIHRCSNSLQYGQKEDHLKMVEQIVNKEKWDYNGLLHKEDQKIIDMLEYLLDDSRKVE